jgi:nicotinamidase-related amidase
MATAPIAIPHLQTLPELAPEWDDAALLIIDVQRDVLDPDGALPIAGTTAVLPKLAALGAHWRATGRPIIHVMRIYRPDGSNADLCRQTLVRRKPVLAPATDGVELVPDLLPDGVGYDWERLLEAEPLPVDEREWLMYKPRWSAFQGTGLGGLLETLGVSTVVVAGCNFPNCPRATLYDATARDLRTVLVADATSGAYDRGLAELANIGVNVVETTTCLAD